MAGARTGRRGGRACASPGMLPRAEYRALLRRARVFVCAPRREDYGIAQLEALADGCVLVTTPSPGPYAALPLARALDPRLVGEHLAAAIRARSTTRAPGYARARAGGARAVAARGCRPRGRRAAAPAVTVARMTPLSGQSVLITGAAHGIGAEVARRLAARGARVSLVGLGADELRRGRRRLPGLGRLRRRRHRPGGARRRRGRRRSRRSAASTPCSPTPASASPASSARWTRRPSSASSRST